MVKLSLSKTDDELKRDERKSKVSVISFFICLGIAIILMVGSAIVPPPFVIDESIFKAVGWLFGFAALGQLPAVLNTEKWAKITHGSTSVVVGSKEDMDRKRKMFGPHYNDYMDNTEDYNDEGFEVMDNEVEEPKC